MEVDEVLATDEFVGVAHVKHFALSLLPLEVLSIKVRCHFTLNLNALYFRQVTPVCQVLPVGFVQLRPNHEIQVTNSIVFAHECRREPQLAVRFDLVDDFLEHLRWHDLHLIQDHQAPVHCMDSL